MSPTVSVIIPCYNQAHFLPDAINSLILQSLEDWECIIVNDGSPDNTREVALDWCASDLRLRYIEQSNCGLSGARNSGLREAKGELIQFLDADDKLEFGKLKMQSEFLKLHPDIDIVFGDARYFTTDKPELREYGYYADWKEAPWIPASWKATGTTLEKLLVQNLFPVNCPLARRKIFNVVGEWNVRLEALEDWEYWIRCAVANISIEFYNAQDTMALIRWHNASMTHDSERADRAYLEMRISVGRVIRDPFLRMKNVEKGLDLLRDHNPPNITKRLIRLVFANLTLRVFLNAAQYIVLERFVPQYLIKPYRKWTPWPIQKFILDISRMMARGRTPS